MRRTAKRPSTSYFVWNFVTTPARALNELNERDIARGKKVPAVAAIATVKKILCRNSRKSLPRDLRAQRDAAIITPSFARKSYIYRRSVLEGVSNPCRTTDRSLGVSTTDANAAQPVVRGVFLTSGSPVSHETPEATERTKKILSTLHFFFFSEPLLTALHVAPTFGGALIPEADYV